MAFSPLRPLPYALPLPLLVDLETCECPGETRYGSILNSPLSYPVASTSPYCYSENCLFWRPGMKLMVQAIAQATGRGKTLPTNLPCLVISKASTLDQQSARTDDTSHDAEQGLPRRSLSLRRYSQGLREYALANCLNGQFTSPLRPGHRLCLFLTRNEYAGLPRPGVDHG
ncbi:hypothetical protein LZ30DRAFT_694874 [Colletotrichum cereale]|nr:hypothetical protein LZ30DRAFT_694874 [Colletotrichum cereale]